jgi:ATP-dependent exoDNAse (exonuclease V) beta subunit
MPFAHRNLNTIVSGTIDRIVLIGTPGESDHAHLVDYKTDVLVTPSAETISERVAFYRPQLDQYREAVVRLFGIPHEHVRAELLFVSAGITCTA